MPERPRRWSRLLAAAALASLSVSLTGCLCYPYRYGCGYQHRGCDRYYEDECEEARPARYEPEPAAQVREPTYRAPEPPPPPTRSRRRRSPEG